MATATKLTSLSPIESLGKPNKSFTTYENATLGFKIEYPSGWNVGYEKL